MSTDLTLVSARADRDGFADRTDVLDRVGVLRMLPDDFHATTDMVAEFYQVDVDAIRQTVTRNREEIDGDGYRVVTRSEFESDIASLSNLDPKVRSLGLYPRRAILRVGMLLRDSIPARQVRDYLLDVEDVAQIVPLELTEDQIVHRAMHILDNKVRVLEAAIERDRPLVAKAEAHTASASAIHRQEFAREVQAWGQKSGVSILHEHVYAFLRHKGMLIAGHRSDRNHATSEAVKRGWAWTDKGTTEDGHPYATTKLNPRGQDVAWKWITAFVKDNGGLDLPRQIGGVA